MRLDKADRLTQTIKVDLEGLQEFALILLAALSLFLLVALQDGLWFLAPLRLLLGFIYVLYVPGYCLVAALFPRPDDLDGLERAGLSLGLSIAWVPILALMLDRLPWGLRLWPILLGEYASILVFMAVAVWRRSRLPDGQAYLPDLSWRPRPWWRSLPASERRMVTLILVVLLVAGLSLAWVILVPSPAEFMTEFYLLGPEGLAENFPRQTAVGQDLQVTLGIRNLERGAHTYHGEIWAEDTWEPARRQKLADLGPHALEKGASLEESVRWAMPWSGPDQKVDFLLFIDSNPQPYRRLRLFIDVEQ